MNKPREIAFRPDVIGDRETVQAVFEAGVYDASRFRRHWPLLSQWYAHAQNPLILDLGAHIGASAIYFAQSYPRARVIAVEPEPGNYLYLQDNASKVPNIFCMNVAVAALDGAVYMYDTGRGGWAYRTSNEPGPDRQRVMAYAVSSLIPQGANPFICKMDIEGAEADIFAVDWSWLSRFALLVTELHDWLLPGQACSRGLLRALGNLDFDVIPYGENLWCFNNDLLRRADDD